MRELITATGLKKLNAYLSEKKDIKAVHDDIDYQEELFNKLATSDPDVLLIIDKLPGPYSKRELSEELIKLDKKMKIVFILAEEDISFVKFLKSRGIKDIINIDDNISIDEDLVPIILFEDPDKEAIKDIITQEEEKEVVTEMVTETVYIKKTVIAVASPGGGGVGKTTLATNIALMAAMKNKNAKIALIDFSDEKSDIARILNISDDKGMTQIAKSIRKGEFNEQEVMKSIEQYNSKISNLYILTGINNLMDIDLYQINHYRKIIDWVKKKFDLVVIDTGSFKSFGTHTSLEKSNKILFIARDIESSIAAVNEKIKFYERDLKIDIRAKSEILMNMTVGTEDLNNDGIKEIFNKEPIATIPYNSSIIFDAEKYNPFVFNNKKFKIENKQMEIIVNNVFIYYKEKENLLSRFLGRRK